MKAYRVQVVQIHDPDGGDSLGCGTVIVVAPGRGHVASVMRAHDDPRVREAADCFIRATEIRPPAGHTTHRCLVGPRQGGQAGFRVLQIVHAASGEDVGAALARAVRSAPTLSEYVCDGLFESYPLDLSKPGVY